MTAWWNSASLDVVMDNKQGLHEGYLVMAIADGAQIEVQVQKDY